jgi:ribosomal protein L29
LKTYTQRLRNRPIKKELEELKKLKDELFDIRLKLASKKKLEPWTMNDLNAALKAIDPHGWLNDLFKEGVARKKLEIVTSAVF